MKNIFVYNYIIMNIVSSVQNSIKFGISSAPTSPIPVLYYTCKIADIDTANKKIKNYANNSYDITYNDATYINSDTNFTGNSAWGSFKSTTSIKGIGSSSYAFTSSTKAITFCFWMKVYSLSPQGYYPVHIGTGGNLLSAEIAYNTSGASIGQPFSIFLYCGGNQTSNGGLQYNNFTTLPKNDLRNWTHFCFVAEYNQVPKLYTNGVQATIINNTNKINTWTNFTSSGIILSNNIPCNVNEVRVYNQALTDAQIALIYGWNGSSTLIL